MADKKNLEFFFFIKICCSFSQCYLLGFVFHPISARLGIEIFIGFYGIVVLNFGSCSGVE